jgi:perosamine synthetase
MRIPLSAPDVTEDEIQAVSEVLRTPHLSLGPKLEEFEEALENYIGVSNAVAISSGTSALHLSIRALGIGEGDEVIVPSFAFIAVANAVRYERAIPVFADIEPKTLNLDSRSIEARITHRTKAIIVVHTFGCPADLDAILDIARRHRLHVIEDCCEAIGAEFRGKKVGTFGDVGVFGFYPNKQITTGEGGAVVTDSAAIANSVRRLRNQGRDYSKGWFQHSELGYNYRISEINCALGVGQLRRIDQILKRREEIAQTYDRHLSGNGHLRLPVLSVPLRKISWFVYVVRLEAQYNEFQRDWIVEEMSQRGIGTGRYFAPIHLQPIYKRQAPSELCPVTEAAASRTVALPFFNRIEGKEIEEVCEKFTDLVESSTRFCARHQTA